jgi:hypothetical protein
MTDYTNDAQENNDDCEYTDEMPVRSAKHGDTLESATKKVIAQLTANKNFLAGVSETLEVPAVYKEVQGAYFVGAKYSNKYLEGVFNGGKNKFAKVKSKAACAAKLDDAIANIRSGQCNTALKAAIAKNIAMHNARKAKA